MGEKNVGDRRPKVKWDPRENMYTHMADRLYQRLLGDERYDGIGWLVGWWNKKDPVRGILHYTGIATQDAARKYELYYGMPIHRLLDGRPRAIPWELDLWMIKFASAIEEAANEAGLGTKQPGGGNGGLDANSKPLRGTKFTQGVISGLGYGKAEPE